MFSTSSDTDRSAQTSPRLETVGTCTCICILKGFIHACANLSGFFFSVVYCSPKKNVLPLNRLDKQVRLVFDDIYRIIFLNAL